jgi:putative intracellular protease/amidase
MTVAVLLFEDFETLDVFGPVEIFGRLKDHYRVSFYSLPGGLVSNYHGVSILTEKLEDLQQADILLVPGGYGTRVEVENPVLVQMLRDISGRSQYILSVCTGSALLAKTGLLDGRKATSNKRAFDWVMTQGDNVNWIKKARWTRDEKYYTSAGVSAGMDMTLGFLQDLHGIAFARQTAVAIEYNWTENMEEDNFSLQTS